MGSYAHNSRAKILVVTGKSTRSYGHNYPLYWATFTLTCFDFSFIVYCFFLLFPFLFRNFAVLLCRNCGIGKKDK